MPEMADILERMRRNPQGILPCAGDPRVNIQRGKAGMAKPYQVRQVVRAVDRLKETADDR